jgi:hypothetical protein
MLHGFLASLAIYHRQSLCTTEWVIGFDELGPPVRCWFLRD